MVFPTYSCEIGIVFPFSSTAGMTSNALRMLTAARKRFPLARYRPGQILWRLVNSLVVWIVQSIPSTVPPLGCWRGHTWLQESLWDERLHIGSIEPLAMQDYPDKILTQDIRFDLIKHTSHYQSQHCPSGWNTPYIHHLRMNNESTPLERQVSIVGFRWRRHWRKGAILGLPRWADDPL